MTRQQSLQAKQQQQQCLQQQQQQQVVHAAVGAAEEEVGGVKGRTAAAGQLVLVARLVQLQLRPVTLQQEALACKWQQAAVVIL
jgi:hypothetical protein